MKECMCDSGIAIVPRMGNLYKRVIVRRVN